METAVSVVVMMAITFAGALAQVISDMAEEQARNERNKRAADIIMAEYESFTEGV